MVSEDGIATDPKKVEAVVEWQTQKDVHDVRSFLGLTSYYRRYIKGYANIARPLHKLTEKDADFTWNEACQGAFEELKGSLVSAPILAYPREEGKFILDTDASGFGIGAVLSQVQDGQEKVICYASNALSKAERNYCVTRCWQW